MLTPTTLKIIFPNCQQPARWLRPLNTVLRQYGMDTPKRAAAFLSQIAVESQELNKLEENLNYAPGRLTAVWPKRFPDAERARPYSRNPEKLANAVYANRLGNGDEASGDGYRFRGRGLIQVTGRANYELIGKVLEVDLINMPDTLLEPRFAALSAGVYWDRNGLNQHADKELIDEITRRVSGSTDSAAQRKRFYDIAIGVLDGDSDDSEGYPANAHSDSCEAPRPANPARAQSWFE